MILYSFVVPKIDAGDVEIVYDQAGRSTGIAYISFSSPTDAKKAVRDLNNKYIGHRYVELSLAWLTVVGTVSFLPQTLCESGFRNVLFELIADNYLPITVFTTWPCLVQNSTQLEQPFSVVIIIRIYCCEI